jgi:ATP-dependent helicase HrpA
VRIDELQDLINAAMLSDQHRLRSRLRGLLGNDSRRPNRGHGPAADRPQTPPRGPDPAILQQLADDALRSAQRREARGNSVPKIQYPAELPVVGKRDEIKAAIEKNQVVVLCGETGSGKTTQLPKICLELGRGIAGTIGHTQPRRIAARSVATRLAQELDVPLGGPGGGLVGYKVRFGDRSGPGTLIKLMTDGILLAETAADRFLSQYDTIIVDEAHERSLNIDFLLGYLHQLLPRRPDLKLIITSATIDPERFANHFASRDGKPAPIINVSGRTYPVEVRYRPLVADINQPEAEDLDPETAILNAVDELSREGSGDVLVFLSGEREIRETAEALRKHHPPGAQILPLYARLSAEEQMRVFSPSPGRRIVLATNVAETSLTVPGIRYVVDTGVARISRYSARTKVQRLPIEAISKASADQRKGRCGRIGPGICIRLYSEQDFAARAEFTEPEILRTNLASVILQMKALRLGQIEQFPFVEPPDSRLIRDGYETLEELGAVDEKGDLTRLGVDLAKLPVDPRLGRMILAAEREGSLREVLVIAAALSIQDPRDRPQDKRDAADAAHAALGDERSDFLAYVSLWKLVREQERHLSHSKFRKWCKEKFLSFNRLREWEDIHRQLHAQVTEFGHKENDKPAEYDAIHRALLTGLLSNIGIKGEQYEYSGARGVKFSIYPGSGTFKKQPKWAMSAELVRTSKLYARTCAQLQPQWIESLARHLIKKTHEEPHWNPDTGTVVARERGTLYGLEIYNHRRVNYGSVDPKAAREIFIHHALVEGDCELDEDFQHDNHTLIDQIKSMEAKARRTSLLADQSAMFEFFDKRIPPQVNSVRSFLEWWRWEHKKSPELLSMTRETLLVGDASDITPDRYPDRVEVHGNTMPLLYRMEPGQVHDGVTLRVPLEALPQIEDARHEWLVPGLIRDKIIELIRGLPKAQRHYIESAPDFADEFLRTHKFGDGDLYDVLGAAIAKRTGVPVPRGAWKVADLSPHLKMNFSVVDDGGKELRQSRELPALRNELGQRAVGGFVKAAADSFHRDGLTTWSFDELPERVEIKRGTVTIAGFPAIVDQNTAVGLRLMPSALDAAKATRQGVRRLFLLRAKDALRPWVTQPPSFDHMAVRYAPYGDAKELKHDLMSLLAERIFMGGDAGTDLPTPRNAAEFDVRYKAGLERLPVVFREVYTTADRLLTELQNVKLQLATPCPLAFADAWKDVDEQVKAMLPKRFLIELPYCWLRHVPRYFAAATARLRKLGPGTLERDRQAMIEVGGYWTAIKQTVVSKGPSVFNEPTFIEMRWLLEEWRVSLFAQELRTSVPVSAKRIAEAWAKVRV